MNKIQNGIAITACDASVKDSKMGDYQVIINIQKQILMEKELFSKSWYINTAKIAKAFILLDFV